MHKSQNERVNDLVQIVRLVSRAKDFNIDAHTSILVELDFDSLQIVELLSTIQAATGVDLSGHPKLLHVLHSPNTIAYTLAQIQKTE